MNIEKLGFTSGPWEVFKQRVRGRKQGIISRIVKNKRYTDICEITFPWRNNDLKLIASAPEMLEALIEERVFIENFLAVWAESIDNHQYNKFNNRAEKIVSIIEKASGKTWQEVKELIK